MGDARVDRSHRWDTLWIHHQAEELRVHHRAIIALDNARTVVTALLASRRVPPRQAPLPDIELAAARPVLQRFWGTVCQHEARVYLFINDRCLGLARSR
jgi:hypothetical protein